MGAGAKTAPPKSVYINKVRKIPSCKPGQSSTCYIVAMIIPKEQILPAMAFPQPPLGLSGLKEISSPSGAWRTAPPWRLVEKSHICLGQIGCCFQVTHLGLGTVVWYIVDWFIPICPFQYMALSPRLFWTSRIIEAKKLPKYKTGIVQARVMRRIQSSNHPGQFWSISNLGAKTS